jgi:site-specific DNA recombinase
MSRLLGCVISTSLSCAVVGILYSAGDHPLIRAETRTRLVAAIVRGRRWLDELIADPTASAETIAKRENCSARKINMTISLAFLAPDLVKAAVDGRLPQGMGVARLTGLPAEWSHQYQMLGLPAQ